MSLNHYQNRHRNAVSTVRASHGNSAAAFDGDPGHSWEKEKGKRDGWIEVDLLKPTPIHAMAFDEPHRGAGKRGQKYRLQLRAGGQWKKVIAGETPTCGFLPHACGRDAASRACDACACAWVRCEL